MRNNRNSRIAKELVLAAKELVAIGGYDTNFTVIRKLRLKREPLGTRVSLENAQKILDAGYEYIDGEMEFDKNKAVWNTRVDFRRKVDKHRASHTFGGFSFGYGGEGPRGLIAFLKMFGVPHRAENITSLDYVPEEKGTLNLAVFM
jgi:hypothetical protein